MAVRAIAAPRKCALHRAYRGTITRCKPPLQTAWADRGPSGSALGRRRDPCVAVARRLPGAMPLAIGSRVAASEQSRSMHGALRSREAPEPLDHARFDRGSVVRYRGDRDPFAGQRGHASVVGNAQQAGGARACVHVHCSALEQWLPAQRPASEDSTTARSRSRSERPGHATQNPARPALGCGVPRSYSAGPMWVVGGARERRPS